MMPVIGHAKTVEVEMRNDHEGQAMVFVPSLVRIDPGDTVVFVPADEGHNSTSVFGPKDASMWTGKTDKKVTIKPTQQGVYVFECTNHKIMGMAGVVVVGEPSNLEEARGFVQKYQETLISNKDRLSKLLSQL